MLATKELPLVDKIAEYEALHKKYAAKRYADGQQKTAGKSSQTRETRSVASVRKKLDDMKTTLGNVKFGDKVDKNEKDTFLKSLQEIIDIAKNTLDRLS